jgi:hypothetical protein
MFAAFQRVAAAFTILAVLLGGVMICPCDAPETAEDHACCASEATWRATDSCCTAESDSDPVVLDIPLAVVTSPQSLGSAASLAATDTVLPPSTAALVPHSPPAILRV